MEKANQVLFGDSQTNCHPKVSEIVLNAELRMTLILKRYFDMEKSNFSVNSKQILIISKMHNFLVLAVLCNSKVKKYFHYLPRNSQSKFDVDVPIKQYLACL